MGFYVLSQREESGCQAGMLNAALCDKFYEDMDNIEYGDFPWYSEKGRSKNRTPLPEGMVLISKDKYYDFDIRGISRFFYIVSDEFLDLCFSLSVEVIDSAKIKVLSIKGESISKKNYNVVIFNELDARLDTDPTSTFVEDEGRPIRFKKLVIPHGLGLDLFKYSRMLSGSDSLICSEQFKIKADNFKGVNFFSLDGLIWSSVKRI